MKTTLEKFELWLAERGEKLTQLQKEAAEHLLSLPLGAGKSFLIKRLSKYDQNEGKA